MVCNSDDIIDSRDIIKRIEELTELKDAVEEAKAAVEEAKAALEEAKLAVEDESDVGADDNLSNAEDFLSDTEDTLSDAEAEFGDDEQEELVTLEALADEAASSPDWRYGETLISESYFTEYARQFADDIGAIDGNAAWPCNHIDWEAAADELKQDYMSVDFGGETYLIHA